MNIRRMILDVWHNIIDKLKARARESKEYRAIARKEREEVRGVEREAYQKERLVVAVKQGKERARRPTGLAGFATGMERLSKGLDKIAPPQKRKDKGPTMADLISPRTKTKGKSMLDFKF